MKKICSFILLLLVVINLTSCKEKEEIDIKGGWVIYSNTTTGEYLPFSLSFLEDNIVVGDSNSIFESGSYTIEDNIVTVKFLNSYSEYIINFKYDSNGLYIYYNGVDVLAYGKWSSD
ncbi:MAG: hypothetical protein ABH890_03800 [Bacillota bacterium]